MKHIAGVSDLKIAVDEGDEIVTHALGSCIGIAVYDPVVVVGGILHYMLPQSKVDPAKAQNNPCMFGDTGIPLLFHELYRRGAKKENLRVVMAGGAQVFEKQDFFDIGKRNVVIARKLFWKNNIMIAAEHVGGHIPRTMFLSMQDGRTWFTSHGQRHEL